MAARAAQSGCCGDRQASGQVQHLQGVSDHWIQVSGTPQDVTHCFPYRSVPLYAFIFYLRYQSLFVPLPSGTGDDGRGAPSLLSLPDPWVISVHVAHLAGVPFQLHSSAVQSHSVGWTGLSICLSPPRYLSVSGIPPPSGNQNILTMFLFFHGHFYL